MERNLTEDPLPSLIDPPELPPARPPLPWTFRDTWIGVGLLALVIALELAGSIYLRISGSWNFSAFQTYGVAASELLMILPVVIILGFRRANWIHLGFRHFDAASMGIGCGLMAAGYVIIMIHNVLLALFHVTTQGAELTYLFEELKSPFGLVFAGVIAAPFVEEIFFRGFLFQGLQQKFSWNTSALLSAAIFATYHLQLVALLPTFILGYIFAFVYHRSKSIWPGVILHFLVNAFGICVALTYVSLSHLTR